MRKAIPFVLGAGLSASIVAAHAVPAAPRPPSWLFIGHLALAAGVLIAAMVTDVRAGRIPNWLVLAGALAGIGMHVFRGLRYQAALDTFALNAGFAFALAFALWWKDVIPAGDAKLIMAAALIFPLDAYPPEAPALFPAIAPIALAFALPALAAIPRAFGKRKAIPLPTLGGLIEAASGYALFFLVFLALSQFLSVPFGFGTVIIAIILSVLLGMPFKQVGWFAPATLAVAGLGAVLLKTTPAFLSGIVFVAAIHTVREGLRQLFAHDVHRIPLAHAKQGVLLPRGTAEGLTADELTALKHEGQRTIVVRREVPFAPWLLTGFACIAFLQLGHALGLV